LKAKIKIEFFCLSENEKSKLSEEMRQTIVNFIELAQKKHYSILMIEPKMLSPNGGELCIEYEVNE